jgi:hypothetical protein
MSDWKGLDVPERPERPLVKTKMKCGCYSYYQRGSGYGIYTLIVHDSCNEDHELAVGPSTAKSKTEEPEVTLEVSVEMREQQLVSPDIPRLSRN